MRRVIAVALILTGVLLILLFNRTVVDLDRDGSIEAEPTPTYQPSFWQALLAGALAGVVVDVVLHPLDTIKTRLQSSNGFWASGGFNGLYSGLLVGAIGSAPASLQPLIHMAAASAGEMVACTVRVPGEVIKQRMQAGQAKTTKESFVSVTQSGGIRGLFRGFWTTVARELFIALALVLAPPLTLGCGINVHIETTRRALELYIPTNTSHVKYKEVLTEFADYTRAGSFFPDWGFSCLGYSQQAEDAHWPPFVQAAVQHVRETYPQPWESEEAKGLIAFVFALTSHGIADIAWHSLTWLTDGFIQAMSHYDFHDDFAAAHGVADTGGDFVLRHAQDVSDLLGKPWKVPVKDVEAIYKRMYETRQNSPRIPSAIQIGFCMRAGYAALQADLRVGKYLFARYGQMSPFLVEGLNDYPKGGVQDMSASVASCWPELANWMEDGVRDDYLCYKFRLFSIEERERMAKTRAKHHHARMHEWRGDPQLAEAVLRDEGFNIVSSASEDGVLTLSLQPVAETSSADRRSQSVFSNPTYEESKDDDNATCTPLMSADLRSVALTLNAEFSGLGQSVVVGDFDQDGLPDLATSAPYYSHSRPAIPHIGSVFILKGRDNTDDLFNTANIADIADVILEGEEQQSQGRFGSAMAVVDLNKDGIDDLVVSAPFTDSKNWDMRGKVYVFWGERGQGLSWDRSSVIEVPVRGNLEKTFGFGQVLVAEDLDGDGFKDLLIGCPMCFGKWLMPQAGEIFALLGSDIPSSSPPATLRPTWSMHSLSSLPYENFGTTMTVATLQNQTVLLVGAPGWRPLGTASRRIGQVYAYNLHNGLDPVTRFGITGSADHQQIGTKIRAIRLPNTQNDQLLVASHLEEIHHSPSQTFWQSGVVRLINITDLTYNNAIIDLEDEESEFRAVLARLEGTQQASHMGSVLASETSDTVWVGEPLADWERGRVYKWQFDSKGDELGQQSVSASTICYHTGEEQARAGSNLIVTDLNRDGYPDLVVTSKYSSAIRQGSGQIHIIYGH
ncbi:hypothetical protein BZG36_02553 [Bifiguratus adelaidae]|uniref:Phosphatidylinositol-glycan-specific phospholipase D n=1 Tax=Bifiguratus adelaidae TaxID=1938954 RepID=A0A261Y236_9FUNG|nr:hypothetical protein BZG36_02553 [Bifiguratus adelaidae]